MEAHHMNNDDMHFLWRSKDGKNRKYIKHNIFYQNEKGEEILVSNVQKEYQDMGDEWEYLGTGVYLRCEDNPDYLFDLFEEESIRNREENSSRQINGL